MCKKRHNTLLHPVDAPKVNSASGEVSETVVNFSNKNSNQVLLSTAQVYILNPITKEPLKVRALLDSGSQSSFITKSLQQKLSINSNPISINVIGIGHSDNQIKESCVIQLKSIYNNYKTKLNCLVLSRLTGNLPKAPINIQQLNIPSHLRLADPDFNQPAPIDILIGADLFWRLMKNDRISLGANKPILQYSSFGWLIGGPISYQAKQVMCNHSVINDNLSNESKVDNLLTKFWELEELPQKTILSEAELACENHFRSHTSRLPSGRFSVRLPLRDSPDCLGDTYNLAKSRLFNLEKRFRKNISLKTQYIQFMKEYQSLGHLSEATVALPDPSYFLCHHAVFKTSSESTKLRVVFDGSASSSSGFSINDLLMIGPNIQDSLFSILIRARTYKYLLTGDIEKMYRQIEVNPDDRNLQLILWREDESLPIKTMQLNTVTYGTASASYLSTRCLWQIGDECDDSLIKNIIQKDFYVDDLITGSNDIEELNYIQNSIAQELNKGCFKLRKYKSNLCSIFENCNLNLQENFMLSEASSTLGLGWNPNNDMLNFPINIPPSRNTITKRSIMSDAFKIFDPLGLLSPYIMQPKLMLQKLWKLKSDWDQPVPIDIENAWRDFSKDLLSISNFQIPRFVLIESPQIIDIHCFSDASLVGYGACVYTRVTSSNNRIEVKLLCSKSKVAPLKPVSIPRLELCAALLSSRLGKAVLNSVRFTPNSVTYWSDSSVVLGWLSSDSTRLKTFVANRVGEIQENTKLSSWRYVPTDQNPADLISRATTLIQLQNSDLWWHGPAFLTEDQNEWPVLKSCDNINLPDLSNKVFL
ncbi:uncharacterized protein LOC123661764 [Melitaea cinxia]|uniref:uncharacterized protein LOC123661764 n=1 Tax=Melitaea cinxia TaxID=113334 RepID=UPI001E2725BF|nr:uncharacterized protein LOC123661764 [Melitaea cinxia]